MNILEQKHNELKAYIENLPLGFISGRLVNTDAKGNKDLFIEDVNQRFADMFGRQKAGFTGKQLQKLIPEFKSISLSGDEKDGAGRHAGSTFYELFIPSLNAHFEVYVSKFKASKASLVVKKIEQATVSEKPPSQNSPQNITAPTGMYKLRADGTLLFASQTLIEILGFTDFEELASRKLTNDRYPLNYTDEQIRKVLSEKGRINHVEATWQRKDGEVVYVREKIKVVYDSEGELQYYEGEVMDISASKITENQLMHLNAIFHELVIEPRRNIEVIVKKSAEVLSADCSLFNQYDEKKSTLINWARFNLEEDPGEDDAEGHVCFERTIKIIDEPTVIENLELTEFIQSDPLVSKYNFKAYLGHPVVVDEKVVGSLCVLYFQPRTFTPVEVRIIKTLANALSLEFKRLMLEENLNAALEEVKVASDAKSQFLSNMSHEIRTPLNGIMGFSEMLMLEEEDSNKRRMLKMIEESGNQLLMIINDIFDYSTIDSGKLELNERWFNLVENIESTVSFFKNQAKAKGLEVNIDTRSVEQKEVIGDASKFSQIIVNLVSNAIKFTDEGSVQVEARSWPKGDKVAIEVVVADTGIGIMAEDLEVIFNEFKQLEYYLTKRIKGTGIGLAITKKLVEYMGGRIVAESEPENGSRFTVSLFMKNKSKNKETAFMEDQVNNEKMAPETIKILLAEDNEANQFLIKAITKNENWNITVVDDGEKAVEAFTNDNFDLVLMDVQMPVMNGYEATRKIREMEKERGTRTPIIALTAYAMKSDKDLCIEAGMDDYISKPFKRQQFLEAVAKILEQ